MSGESTVGYRTAGVTLRCALGLLITNTDKYAR